MKRFFFTCYTICFSFVLSAVDIVNNSRETSCIIIDKKAPAPIQTAAAELAFYTRKITGATIPIKEKNDKNLYPVHLEIRKNAALGAEGYSIKSSKNSLVISGNTPRAVLYGTYAFIEQFFGVRWFAPGELYEYCPSNKKLSIPDDINITAKPDFVVRQVGFVGCNWNSELYDSMKFLARNRYQVKGNIRHKKMRHEYDKYDAVYSDGGHTLAKLIPDSLFETHPEYFALVKGKRIKQIAENGQAQSQPCTSNSDVIALAIKGINEYFDNAPPDSSYLIGNNDVQVWCECSKCIAQDSPEERKKGYVSTRFFKFINQVVKGVRQKHPEAQIKAWGYQNYRFAPDGIVPDSSLRINLCDHQRCYRHSMGDTECRQNDTFRDMFKSWKSYGLHVTERGYQEVLLRDGYFYLPIENVIAGDLRYFKKNNIDGYVFTTNPPDGKYSKRYGTKNTEYRKNAMYCLWPALYICGKMLWNSDLDPQEIWEDAGKHFYGSAWQIMKEYRKLLTDAYIHTDGHIIYCNPPVDIGKSLQKPGIKQKLLSLLEKAEKIAATDTDTKVAKRIALEKKYFLETWIRNAVEFEKTLSRTSSASEVEEKICIDGIMQEKSWRGTQYITGFINKVEPPAYPADVFAKVLYDKDFIYMSIVGSNPVAGEKWLLMLPDHGNLTSPFKIFELDKNTPFEKSAEKSAEQICFELKIPRKLINLSENAAAFFVNVRRMQFNDVCGELFKSNIGSIVLGVEAVKNSNFADEKMTSPKQKKIKSKKFPAKWGFAGKSGNFKDGKVSLSGTLYQYMQVNGGKKGGFLKIDVIAAAEKGKKGDLRPYLSLQKSAGGKKFRHEIKKYGKQTVVNSKAVYHFKFELAPDEKGYIYINGNNVIIENISAAFEPLK